jgi:hypothetical protein
MVVFGFPDDSTISTVDLPQIWNQKPREGMWLHWDENNNAIKERNYAAFNTCPQVIPIADKVSFVIAGDWGTGDWRDKAPSTKLGEQMQTLGADYSIYLGDVYYAGTKEQEINNLVDSWPQGSKGSFTLNSNHEMYNGAYSYYEQASANKYTEQKGCSYFALEDTDWLIIGLDTAYYADPLDLYLKGKLDDTQVNWLKTLPKKRVMVLTHHEAYDLEGKTPSTVYQQVIDGLGREPFVCYWCHAHNAIVYAAKGWALYWSWSDPLWQCQRA